MQNSKILKPMKSAFIDFDIFTLAFETLKKCFIVFLASFFKFIVLVEVYKIFNSAFELYTLVYLFLSLFEMTDGFTLLSITFSMIFIFIVIMVSVCVFFDKKGNNEVECKNSYFKTFCVVSSRLNC